MDGGDYPLEDGEALAVLQHGADQRVRRCLSPPQAHSSAFVCARYLGRRNT